MYQDTGFVFTLKKTDLEGELPKGFINVAMKKGKWMFSSMELVLLSSLRRGQMLSDVALSSEKDECKDEGCFRRDVNPE